MEETVSSIPPLKRGFFITRILKYQVITFTILFLFFYRFLDTLMFYSLNKEHILREYNLSIWVFLLLIIIFYFIQWLIATLVASQLTIQTLKDKFNRHPIVTILFSILYLADLPFRLSEHSLGGGLIKLINAFEIIVYYIFVTFLWWLLICWISSIIWKSRLFKWNWYDKSIDKLFSLVPLLYKIVFSIIVSLYLFYILFYFIAKITNYSGSDLNKLINK